MKNDPKQQRLRELFAELRRIKQQELPFWWPDEFVMVYRQAQARKKIVEIEKEIENLVTQTYGLGFTNFRASGGAVVDGSVVTDDVTLVFVFIWAEEETIHELVEDVREKYGISTVLIEKHKVSAELIG